MTSVMKSAESSFKVGQKVSFPIKGKKLRGDGVIEGFKNGKITVQHGHKNKTTDFLEEELRPIEPELSWDEEHSEDLILEDNTPTKWAYHPGETPYLEIFGEVNKEGYLRQDIPKNLYKKGELRQFIKNSANLSRAGFTTIFLSEVTRETVETEWRPGDRLIVGKGHKAIFYHDAWGKPWIRYSGTEINQPFGEVKGKTTPDPIQWKAGDRFEKAVEKGREIWIIGQKRDEGIQAQSPDGKLWPISWWHMAEHEPLPPLDKEETEKAISNEEPKTEAMNLEPEPGEVASAEVSVVELEQQAAETEIRTEEPRAKQEAQTSIPLNQIKVDGGTQSRAGYNEETLANYAELWESGVQFPAVVLFFDGTDYWLADGFHRVQSAKTAKISEIKAEVRQGTRRDAVLYSVGANSTHGLPRTNADKRRAVEVLLRDEEWQKWSDNEIARRCSVSQPFVRKLRMEAVSYNGYKIEEQNERLVTRNGTTYTQRTKSRGGGRTTATTDLTQKGRSLGLPGGETQQLPETQQNDATPPPPPETPSPWSTPSSFTFELLDGTPIVGKYLPSENGNPPILTLTGEITRNPNGSISKIVSQSDRDGCDVPIDCARMLADLARRSYLAELNGYVEVAPVENLRKSVNEKSEQQKYFADWHTAWVSNLEEMPDHLLISALEEVARRALKGRSVENLRRISNAATEIMKCSTELRIEMEQQAKFKVGDRVVVSDGKYIGRSGTVANPSFVHSDKENQVYLFIDATDSKPATNEFFKPEQLEKVSSPTRLASTTPASTTVVR